MIKYPLPTPQILRAVREGQVIPAHPLALTARRKLDERRQRALTRYYHAAGAGGIAVGVHTTQFEIRKPEHGLLRPVLELAAETIRDCDEMAEAETVRVAGVCGRTRQAVAEASLARDAGYHIGLLSLGALKEVRDPQLLEHCEVVARELPIMGFYLQPAAGGRLLSRAFWRRFAEIPNVVAIKIAPFNRYQTLDVVRAVAEAGRANDIALYTGNDDHILLDLLTEYRVPTEGRTVRLRIAGGLLGHWAGWTRRAVDLLNECKTLRLQKSIPAKVLTLAEQVTDCNAAWFDATNQFAGCIPGIQEVLRRQGLLANRLCLEPNQALSYGQSQEITRVQRAYPHLNDDAFVEAHLEEWLKP